MIKLKDILTESQYPVVVGIITKTGRIQSEETTKSHRDLQFARGQCWRYNPLNKTIYWHGDDSEHDEVDENNVEFHVDEKYGYTVRKNVTLENSRDDGYTTHYNGAHGLFESTVVYHAGEYTVGKSFPEKQQSGYYRGLYVSTNETLASNHGTNVKKFTLKPDIKLWTGNGDDLKGIARKAGYSVTMGSGYGESKYLEDVGYDGLQRGQEIVLFNPDNALREL